MIERKQPNRVVTIDGRGGAGDRITQTELASVSDLQAAAWAAEQNAQEAVLRIEGRLRRRGSAGLRDKLKQARPAGSVTSTERAADLTAGA